MRLNGGETAHSMAELLPPKPGTRIPQARGARPFSTVAGKMPPRRPISHYVKDGHSLGRRFEPEHPFDHKQSPFMPLNYEEVFLTRQNEMQSKKSLRMSS